MPSFRSREEMPAHLRPDNTVDALEEHLKIEQETSNAVAQEEMREALSAPTREIEVSEDTASGPFDHPLLNAALSESFGASLDGISADWSSEEEAESMGAQAFTQGSSMSFGRDTTESITDTKKLDTIGHEVSHALAGGGSGQTALDQAGDAGESTADQAGQRFAAWGRQGFQGDAPKLEAARGGKAEIHRKKSGRSRGVLRRGARGSSVTTLQQKLRSKGYRVSVDGDFGPATEDVVQAFQRRRGLSADGVVGPQTWAALLGGGGTKKPGGGGAKKPGKKKVKVTGVPPMRYGSRGSQVKALQKILRIRADGVFGGGTQSAVRRFQSRKNLAVDGVVGPQTARVLNGGKPPKGGNLRYMTGNGGRRLGMVRRQNEWMLPRTAAAFDRLNAAARRDGVNLRIVDGFRSYREQVYLAQTLGLYNNGGLAAVPGTSNHGLGIALDLNDGRGYSWLARNAPRAGMRRTVPREAWHWEV